MNTRVVVDTDVVSFIFKQDTRANLYYSHIVGKILLVSFMTIAELDRWILQHKWGDARKKLMEIFLRRYIIIHSDRPLCLKWAEAVYSARLNGKPIRTADAWVAATALHHGIPLVTHNSKHYVGVDGLTVISETAP